jgi:hypothetical protein
MKLTVEPSELLTEGKFEDFLKATAFGAGLALAPMTHAAPPAELPVAELPADLVASYNVLDNTSKLGVKEAVAMADELALQVDKEIETAALRDTEAWGTAKATYDYLLTQDYNLATRFLSKFNSNMRERRLGDQLRALPKPVKNESKELPISVSYLNEKLK